MLLDKVMHLDHRVVHNKMLAVVLVASSVKVQGNLLEGLVAEELEGKVEVT